MWTDIPKPTDNTTWMGVTRRNNLLSLASRLRQFDIPAFQNLMDTKIEDGDAVWNLTIYQIIFDGSDLSLYLRITISQSEWTKVSLKDFFQLTSLPFFSNKRSEANRVQITEISDLQEDHSQRMTNA